MVVIWHSASPYELLDCYRRPSDEHKHIVWPSRVFCCYTRPQQVRLKLEALQDGEGTYVSRPLAASSERQCHCASALQTEQGLQAFAQDVSLCEVAQQIMAQPVKTQHSMQQHSMAWHGVARHSIP